MKSVTSKTLRGALVLATTLAISPVLANSTSEAYTMTVIRDTAQGANIIKGNYDKAIEKITRADSRYAGDFAGENNLCVAYTKSGDLKNAEEACNAAVNAVQVPKRGHYNLDEYTRRLYATDLAIALSNRGVVRAAMGKKELAEKDFRDADELETRISAPAINLARVSR